jgi:hypothetical protein
MICDKTIRDGTNQLERQSEFLKEGFVNLDERSQEDLLRFIYEFASELAYYNPGLEVAGSWQEILGDLSDLQNLQPPGEQDKVPHIGLLIALTKLYGYAQDEINTITERHLNYYYREVLRIQAKKATPDQVQLVLRLAKSNSFDEFLLKANTSFDAGKDVEGKSLIYKTEKEAIISRAAIQQVKTLFLDKEDGETRIFMAPVANSLDGLGKPLEENTPFWPSFGESQVDKDLEGRTMADASIGFAISSSVLLLKEGDRTVHIDINFDSNPDFSGLSSLQNAFTIYYSGAEAWEQPDFYTSALVNAEGLWQLQLRINIDTSQSAFTFFDPELVDENFSTKGPTLKVILKPESLGYDTLKQLKVSSVDIEVEANGMKDHLLQSNAGVLNPESPFLPFGAQPALGNSFYIGNVEIFQKKLHSLKIEILWHDIPARLSDHYEQYGIDANFGNNSFESQIYFLLNKSWNQVSGGRQPLFESLDAADPHKIALNEEKFAFSTNYEAAPSKAELSPYSITTGRGFIKIDLLSPEAPPFRAFGHKEFPQLYADRAIALATYDPAGGGTEPVLPNQPYTPAIKELSLGYNARETIHISAQNEYDGLFQIGPFGFRPIESIYHKELIPFSEEEGALIIGLDGFSPPQTLNLLFDLEEGTAKRSVILEPENITWNYLADNRWIELAPQEILADGTRGFKQSGIISLIIPKDASNANDYLPQGLFWIKAEIAEGAEGANKIKSIFSNAVNAILDMDGENYDAHLTGSLAAENITSLSNRVKEIKKVEQPLKSNKGIPGESAIVYNLRVSERLRHKNRAARLWDYERMVLEAFPDIFKVKCLAHTGPESESDAGSVTLIVVSNLRNKDTSNPFQPGTSQLVLDEVEDFMKEYISPFIKVYVELPLYESILIDAKIGFQPGFDPGFYSKQLNQELKEFLSPWAFMDGIDIEIGGAIYKSSILQFIESRIYVDYVVDFNLYHKGGRQFESGISEMEIELDFEIADTISSGIGEMILESSYVVGEGVNVACATSPRSVLVSALDHRITALRPDEYVCSGASSLGIGFMTVNLDLVIDE